MTAPRAAGPSGRTRFLQTLAVCILAVVMLGAGPNDPSARFGRVGGNLVCVCGCGQMLLQCNHVGCPDSPRMLAELQAQLAGPNGQGADSLILNWFVAKYGATVLAAPIRGGFDIVAWIIPLTLFVGAIFGTAILVRVWARRRLGGDTGLPINMPIDNSTQAQIRSQIRRDTEW